MRPVESLPPRGLSMGCRAKILRVEPLEGRVAPATLVSPTRVTYQDVDGDAVTVTVSRPVLTLGNVNTVFTFGAGGVSGDNSTPQQLRSINLTTLEAAAKGMSINVTAVPGAGAGGDGQAA